MTTLENSYCVPTKEQWDKIQETEPKGYINLIGYYQEDDVIIVEWDHIDAGFMILSKKRSDVQDRKEISVQHFVDLVDDRISSWRLEEFGFNNKLELFVQGFNLTVAPSEKPYVYIEVSHHADMDFNITTFTELLTLIKFLTPPTT